MKIPTFATTAAFFGTAIFAHGQEAAIPDASATDKPAAESRTSEVRSQDTQDTANPDGALGAGAERDQGYRDLKSKLEEWEGAESEQMPMSEVPDAARETVEKIAEGAPIADMVNVYTKGDKQVYAAKITPEDQKHIKLFVRSDGEVEIAKQATTLDDTPEVVSRTITEHTENQSPDEMYRVIAQATTAYIAIVKGDGGQAKIITVGNNGRHIDTQTMDRVGKLED